MSVKQNEVFTVEQLAEKLQISERSILDSIRAGKLVAYKKFRRWFVFASDFENFIRTHGSSSAEGKKE